MKARISKKSEKKESQNQNEEKNIIKRSPALTKFGYLDPNRPMSIIKTDIKTVYDDLIQNASYEDLGLAINEEEEKYSDFDLKSIKIINLMYILHAHVDQFKISVLLKKPARSYILELLKNELSKLLEEQYQPHENDNSPSQLDLLLDISEKSFLDSIKNSPMPEELKTTILDTYESFTQKKLAELNMSSEDFHKLLNGENQPVHKENSDKSDKDTSTPDSSSQSSEETSNIVNTDKSDEEASNKNNTFYNQVKAYTNNFQFLFVSDYMKAQKHKFGKFENYENYLKFDTFQRKLKEYKNKKHISELEAIQRILNSKNESIRNELSKIDPEFMLILESRKQAILQKTVEEK